MQSRTSNHQWQADNQKCRTSKQWLQADMHAMGGARDDLMHAIPDKERKGLYNRTAYKDSLALPDKEGKGCMTAPAYKGSLALPDNCAGCRGAACHVAGLFDLKGHACQIHAGQHPQGKSIMMFRKPSLELVNEWIDIIEKDSQVWDQNAFNDLFRRMPFVCKCGASKAEQLPDGKDAWGSAWIVSACHAFTEWKALPSRTSCKQLDMLPASRSCPDLSTVYTRPLTTRLAQTCGGALSWSSASEGLDGHGWTVSRINSVLNTL
eukprot:1156326-Pelagomonas_calceolata.AAC.4